MGFRLPACGGRERRLPEAAVRRFLRSIMPPDLFQPSTDETTEGANMSTHQDPRIIQPYLFFNGRCDEAVAFYRQALGAEVEMLMRFKESPEPPPPGTWPPGFEEKVMHCSLRVGGTVFMLSDGCSAEPAHFQGFSLSLTVAEEAEADRAFSALAVGGNVTMPLARTFWSPRFGMLEDRFGVGWMIMVMPTDA